MNTPLSSCHRVPRGWLAVTVLLASCAEPVGPVSDFVGHWIYEEGMARVTCDGMRASQELEGATVEIESPAPNRLLLIAGPRCNLNLNVEASMARAEPGARCAVSVERTSLDARLSRFELSPELPRLSLYGTGDATVEIQQVSVECESMELVGVLARDPAELD